jgi:hypothetical protein
MYIPKKYGSYRTSKCPFCLRHGTTKNKQKIPVCSSHKNQVLQDLKCNCGSYVDLLEGKWGPYFSCIKCGNVQFNKIMEVNDIKTQESVKTKAQKKKFKPKETIVRSDEVDFMY